MIWYYCNKQANGKVILMREWKSGDLDEKIRKRAPSVNRDLVRNRREKVMRRRPRDKEEQNILDLLCKRNWEQDLAKGRVKIISKREWYCEFDG